MNWLHKLFNPHCQHCIDEARENRVCESCETLRGQLERANHLNEQLMARLLEKPIEPVIEKDPSSFKPLNTNKQIPWNVRRQALEKEDRETARLRKQSVEELEKELGVSNGTESGTV